MIEKYTHEEEKINDYREFDFENGVKLIFRILNDEPSLRFVDKDGKDLLDLLSLAPGKTGVRLSSKKEGWGANPTDNGYEILVHEFEGAVEGILSFLHEAGHLHNNSDLEIKQKTKELHREERLKDKLNAYPNSRIKALKEEMDVVLESERKAWSFAFKKAREIEKNLNIEIFNRIDGRGAIYERARNFANKYIGTYEKNYLYEFENIDIFGKKQIEEFFEGMEELEEAGSR